MFKRFLSRDFSVRFTTTPPLLYTFTFGTNTCGDGHFYVTFGTNAWKDGRFWNKLMFDIKITCVMGGYGMHLFNASCKSVRMKIPQSTTQNVVVFLTYYILLLYKQHYFI